MVRWSGFADLEFPDGAQLAFVRAAELAETDVHEQYADAWAIEDRRITFSLDVETGRPALDAIRRFLTLLVREATAGEAVIEIAFPRERWVRRPVALSSSKEIVIIDGIGTDEDDEPSSKTIRSTSLLIDPDDKLAEPTGCVGQVVNAGSRAPRRIQQKRAV
jgi:hypothetical protein